jgi:hypothetical protein
VSTAFRRILPTDGHFEADALSSLLRIRNESFRKEQAAEKKLAGAAKTSLTKKCVTDATTAAK